MAALAAGDLVVAAAFAVLSLRALRSGRDGVTLVVACLATSLWAALAALREMALPSGEASVWPGSLADAAAALRAAAWLAVLLSAMRADRDGNPSAAGRSWRRVGLLPWIAAVLVMAVDLGPAAGLAAEADHGWRLAGLIGHLALALAGLVAVENAWRNVPRFRLWAVKFGLIALGMLFAYDFFLYAEAVLFARHDVSLLAAQPLVAGLAAPLLWVSARRRFAEVRRLAASQQFVFHSAAILGSGCYLTVMGGAALYIRELGGSWGPVAQVLFLGLAGILLAVLLASGSLRARLKVAVAKHLFAYRYDYREEWLRFIAAMAGSDDGRGLRLRAIEAVAGIVGSPAGALWLRDDPRGSCTLACDWNWRGVAALQQEAVGDLPTFLERTGWVVDVRELMLRPAAYGGLACPQWLREQPRAWLVVPLIHRRSLTGFLLLHQSRAPRQLDWEDYDLLKTVGRQAAAFLAEQQAVSTLAEGRQIELFNRRFAFVAHDLKTVIGQLSLSLANAERHGDDRRFQNDFMIGIRDSVERISRMLAELNARRFRDPDCQPIDLVPLIRRLAEQRSAAGGAVRLEQWCPQLWIAGDEARLATIVGHLVQNASEAAHAMVRISLRADAKARRAVLEIEDDGPGMDAGFVRDELFRPLATTKRDGYGIGAYQCRELVRELGGQLAVATAPGRGTTIRVTLPMVGTPAGDHRPVLVAQ